MWPRILRILSTGFNVYRLSASPAQFIATVVTIILAPYLIYVFWGSLILFVLLILGGWLLYRLYKKGMQRQ